MVLQNNVPRFINYFERLTLSHFTCYTRWNHLLHGQFLESTFPFPLFRCHQHVVSFVPPPMKGALLFPRLIMIRTKWAAREGVSVDKKKYLWFNCRHISPKRLPSLFYHTGFCCSLLHKTTDSKCVWLRFGLFWQIQCTLRTLITSKHSFSHRHLDFIGVSEKQKERYLKEVTFSVFTG